MHSYFKSILDEETRMALRNALDDPLDYGEDFYGNPYTEADVYSSIMDDELDAMREEWDY